MSLAKSSISDGSAAARRPRNKKRHRLNAYGLARRAEADLDDIAYYIAKESDSLEIARRVIEAITDRFHLFSAQAGLSNQFRLTTRTGIC